MAGRIRDEDVALVRERSQIADVIGEHVQLRNAGGGNLKGLCPFHDEKSASFNVTPARGLFHCFGCQAGGDVIKFVQDVERLDFADAVERLAIRAGVQLRYVDGGAPMPDRHRGQRQRLLDANAEAATFYAAQLGSAQAGAARDYLTERGFDLTVAARYGCGYAPAGWDDLTKHLLGKRFTGAELVSAGLAREGGRGGLIDRFHRRLLWPIRDLGGDTVGFGARRLYDDDKIEAKYLNTPETPVYKKSQLLYGLDLAKRDIARRHQAVIVEGYTDVMAAHLSGVPTAVATCGTAFGSEHVSLVRRLLMDSDAFTGEVIFTFDGDEAGMKAAERAFADDQKFMAQTFVAIEDTGLDPCDLRMKSGESAVLDLVARRIPLVEFVLRATVRRFDLDTAEGRSTALDRGVPMVARIKDFGLRDEYARRLAGLIGMDDPMRVVTRVRGFSRAEARSGPAAGARNGSGAASGGTPAAGSSEPAAVNPAPVQVEETVAAVEREMLKVALQLPAVAGPEFDALGPEAFLVERYRSLREAIAAAGGTSAAVSGPAWTAAVQDAAQEQSVKRGAQALSVEPLPVGALGEESYGAHILARMLSNVAGRQIKTIKSRLQRMNPQEEPDAHARMFGELIALESYHRGLLNRVHGG